MAWWVRADRKAAVDKILALILDDRNDVESIRGTSDRDSIS